METKSASTATALSRAPGAGVSSQAATANGNLPRIGPSSQQDSQSRDQAPRLTPPKIPPKPAPRVIAAYRDETTRRPPLSPTSDVPAPKYNLSFRDEQVEDLDPFHRHRTTSSSIGKSEDDSNDSDESEDTFQDFDDLRDCVKTEGNRVVVPESIDSIVIDDGDEKTRVQLTERQKKSLENRLSTFSMRVKNKQQKTDLRVLFEPMKQTYAVNPYGNTSLTVVDGHGHSRPVSTYEPATEFKPQRYPQLAPISLDKPSGKLTTSGLYSSSNLARFQSTPNIASPDLYGGLHSAPKRIDALKNQGKNIHQKFKNLFVRKQTRKNFNLGSDATTAEQVTKRRTSSNHDFDEDEEPQAVVIPPLLSKREEDRSSMYMHASQQGHHRSSGKIDTDVDFTGGVEIRSIRYNASYRKPTKKSEIRRYDLLEPQRVEPNIDLSESLSDFGVIFCIDNNYLKSFSLRNNVAYFDDLTKNCITAAAKVALLELGADLKDVLKRDAHDVKMPRFKDTRKKANSNLIFGGYLTQLHQLDKKRNPNTPVEYPSVLQHIICYLHYHGVREEGIFRVTGTQNRLNNLKNEVSMLYQSYYKHNKPDDKKEIYDIFDKYSPYDVAGLLKLFLRELTKPLFTDELMEIFLKVPAINRLDMQIKILNLLMLILNDSHRNSLYAVLYLLHQVVQNQGYNKMSLEGVCTVMAPNLMIDRQSQYGSGAQSLSPSLPSLMTRRMSFSSQSVNEVSEEMAAYLRRTTNSLSVLKLLINLHPILFHIPPYIYRQMKQESF